MNLDDCWAEGRDSKGVVYPDPVRFPHGIDGLADYAHTNGLKLGVYTDRGNMTCGRRPGSYGYEELDAQTYASWGVDYLKEDSCWATEVHEGAFAEYAKMRDALNATGRPIVFSLCGWNSWYAPVGYSLGNLWRIGSDDSDWPGVLADIDINSNLAQYAGPGGWNDPCLLLGNTYENEQRVTEIQSRTQFNIWSIMSSPLLISANVRNLSQFQFETYANIEVINVDQDPLGKQGIRLSGGNLSQGALTNVWGRLLYDNSWAILFLNNGNETSNIVCDQDCFAMTNIGTDKVKVRDLWLHEDLGDFDTGFYAVDVPAFGDSVMLKFTPLY